MDGARSTREVIRSLSPPPLRPNQPTPGQPAAPLHSDADTNIYELKFNPDTHAESTVRPCGSAVHSRTALCVHGRHTCMSCSVASTVLCIRMRWNVEVLDRNQCVVFTSCSGARPGGRCERHGRSLRGCPCPACAARCRHGRQPKLQPLPCHPRRHGDPAVPPHADRLLLGTRGCRCGLGVLPACVVLWPATGRW